MSKFSSWGGGDVIVIDSDDESNLATVQKRQKLNQPTANKPLHNIVKSRQIRSTMLPVSKSDTKQDIVKIGREVPASFPCQNQYRRSSPFCLGKRVRSPETEGVFLGQPDIVQNNAKLGAPDEGYGSFGSSEHSPNSHHSDTEIAESFAMKWADLTKVEPGSFKLPVTEAHIKQRNETLAALAKRDELTRLGVQKSQTLRAEAFATNQLKTIQDNSNYDSRNNSPVIQAENSEPDNSPGPRTDSSARHSHDVAVSSDFSEHINHEKLLDQAEKWAEDQNQSHENLDMLSEVNHPRPTSSVYPQSRAAAETYRTQDRHIREHDNQDENYLRRKATLELRQAEARLVTLSKLHHDGNHVGTDSQRAKEPISTSYKLIGVPSSPTPPLRMPKFGPPPPPHTSHHQPKTHRFHGSEADRMAEELPRQVNPGASTNSNGDQSSYSMLQATDTLPTNDRDLQGVSNGFEVKAQGVDLTLPRTFDDLDEHTQLIIRKHETLKERERDLKAIKEVTLAVAQLGAMVAFQDIHYDQIREIRKFTKIVLKDNLCSRPMRTRISNIRDNFKRRAGKYGSPSQEKIEIILQDLLSYDDAKVLTEELSNLKREIQHLGAQRLECTSSRHSTRPRINRKKSVRFRKSPAEHDSIDLGEHQTHYSKSLSKSERSRLAFERSQERKIAQLKAKRDRFDASVSHTQSNTTEDSSSRYLIPMSDDSENDSEEIEGEQFYPGLRKESPPMQNVGDKSNNGLGYDHQQMDRVHRQPTAQKTVVKSSQNPDISLIRQAESEAAERDHRLMIGVQRRNHDLVERLKEREITAVAENQTIGRGETDEQSEDGNLSGEELSRHFDDSESDGYDERQPLYRYKVLAVFRGIPGKTDGCEELIGKYLNCERAQKRAVQIMHNVQEQYRQMEPDYGNHHTINHNLHEGLLELSYESILGRQVGCRVWMEREVRNVSRELYEKARQRYPKIMDMVYAVEWKRTVTDYMSDDEAEDHCDEAEAEIQDPGMVTNNQVEQNAYGVTDELCPNQNQQSLSLVHGTEDVEPTEPHHESCTGTAEEEGDHLKNINESRPTISETIAVVDTAPLSSSDDNLVVTKVATPQGSVDIHPTDTDDLFSDTASNNEPGPLISTATKQKSRAFKETTASALSNDSTRLFTSIAYANRHAKNVFFYWFIRDPTLQGVSNLAFIRAADDAFEAELERLEDLSTWQGNGEYEGCRTDEYTGEETKTVERFTVWVRKISLRGPVNR